MNNSGEKSHSTKWSTADFTKFFKEFALGGKRIETRMFWKVSATYWAKTAYRWNDKETEATRTGGEDIALASGVTHDFNVLPLVGSTFNVRGAAAGSRIFVEVIQSASRPYVMPLP